MKRVDHARREKKLPGAIFNVASAAARRMAATDGGHKTWGDRRLVRRTAVRWHYGCRATADCHGATDCRGVTAFAEILHRSSRRYALGHRRSLSWGRPGLAPCA